MSETLIRDIDRQQLVDVFVVESEETLASLEELLLRLEQARKIRTSSTRSSVEPTPSKAMPPACSSMS